MIHADQLSIGSQPWQIHYMLKKNGMAFFESRVDCCKAMMQNQSLLRSCRAPEAWVINKKWDVGLNFTENTWQMRSPVYITQFPFTTLLFTTLHLVSALPKNTKREEEHFFKSQHSKWWQNCHEAKDDNRTKVNDHLWVCCSCFLLFPGKQRSKSNL